MVRLLREKKMLQAHVGRRGATVTDYYSVISSCSIVPALVIYSLINDVYLSEM